MFPMDKITANGMSPAHVTPNVAEGVVLVKKMILAFKEDQTVWVIHEILWRGKTRVRSHDVLGGPCRMRSRIRTVASGSQGTSKLQPKRHGSTGSIHQVTPALAYGSTSSAAWVRLSPGVAPECTASNGESVVRYFWT